MADVEAGDPEALADEIAARLAALPSRATAPVRELRREYSRRLARAAPATVLAVARRLLAQPGFEARFVAYELIAHHRGALGSLGPAELVEFGRGLDSWYAVDTFAPYLAGPAWREGQVPDSLIHEWARSPDRWWRRAALVSTIGLNTRARGGRGDTARTLAVCRLLVADRDDMVVKALSWALRELVVHDPDAVRAFLAEHGDSLAARVRREVNNVLASGLKNPRRDVAANADAGAD
jgi:3-methyladenine DNA glycosylase AlkD